METTKKPQTVEEVRETFDDFSRVIYRNIPEQLKKNKVIAKYIYLSAELTLINLFKNRYYKRRQNYDKNFEIVSYQLGSDYTNIIKLVVNKSLLDLASMIKETIDKFKVGDVEYDILMNSVFGGSDKNEDYYTLD